MYKNPHPTPTQIGWGYAQRARILRSYAQRRGYARAARAKICKISEKMVKNRHFLAKNDHFLVKNAYFKPFCAQKWVPWRPKKGRQIRVYAHGPQILRARRKIFFEGGLYTLVCSSYIGVKFCELISIFSAGS